MQRSCILIQLVYHPQKFKDMAALTESQTVPTSPLNAQVLNCGYTSDLGDWEGTYRVWSGSIPFGFGNQPG